MDKNIRNRVLILCGDGPHHRYLVSYFSVHHDVCGVIVEKHSGIYKSLLKKHHYYRLLTQAYHSVRRMLSGDKRYRERFFAIEKQYSSYAYYVSTTDSINSSDTIDAIKRLHPDVIVVMGTSILKESVLNAAGDTPIINIHGGYLPFYRGNHCFFFALLNMDYEHIASTIHLIDVGIDSGAIIARVHPYICMNDSAESLYCKAEMQAIKYLSELLNVHGRDIVKLAVPQSNSGKIYYTKDRKLRHELKMLIVKRKMHVSPLQTFGIEHID